jgi:NDP-sugar pyrophosphorylase family protein
MRGMILAAGFGTRLRPLTDECPKPLIDVGGKPMIAYALEMLRGAGITEVAVNLHHLAGQIRDALGHGEKYGVEITYFEEKEILDTGGGVAAARSFLEGGDFVVANADSVTDLPLADMVAYHRERDATATMFLRRDPQAAGYGLIEIDAECRIRRFLGQPQQVEGPLLALMFGGVHVLSPRVFGYMQGGAYGITRQTYPRMLAASEALYGYVFDGYWQVLDTHAGLQAGRAIAKQRAGAGRSST